ncbi:MAG TPA: LPS assembly lipoprotein LptE [Burkholderiales bacterium]|nr:LPS assembly lipoprotein LptE [Burkholderiales bacterium]
MRAALAGFVVALLAGCGFHLRGSAQLPFETIYIPGATPLAVELRRNVTASSKTRLADSPKNAQAVLAFTQEAREKVILSFTSAGKVNEYRLRYRVGIRVTDTGGSQVFLPASEILLTRDMTFNDQQVIAKENEEALLYRDMQTDMVQQIMRRLAAARPQVE